MLELDALDTFIALPGGCDGVEGDARVLGLRHDEVEVRPGSDALAGWIKGRIESRCYIGRAVDLEVRIGHRHSLRCRVDDARAVDWPEDVVVRLVPDRAVLLRGDEANAP